MSQLDDVLNLVRLDIVTKLAQAQQEEAETSKPGARWSEDDKRIVTTLHQQGITLDVIADVERRTVNSIGCQLGEPMRPDTTSPRAGEKWSDEEDADLLYMRHHGAVHHELASWLGRTEGSVIARLRLLQRQEADDSVE